MLSRSQFAVSILIGHYFQIPLYLSRQQMILKGKVVRNAFLENRNGSVSFPEKKATFGVCFQ